MPCLLVASCPRAVALLLRDAGNRPLCIPPPPRQMTPPHKPWFKSMIYLELFLQLPYFIVGFYAFVGEQGVP